MKTVLLAAGGRAGADFFHSLIDGHSQILQFPGYLRINENFKTIFKFKDPHKIAKQFINHGLIDRDNHQSLGFNFRMNEIQAAMGLIQLKKLNKYNSLRIKNSLYLLKKLRDKNIKWLKPQSVNRNIYHTYFWCPVEIISNKINTVPLLWKYFMLSDYT